MCCGSNVNAVNAAVEIIKALTPFIVAGMPFLMLLGNWWITKQTKNTTAAQTRDLKQHSDENQKKTIESVAESTGTHQALRDGS
jgi:hypothetical protein